MLLRCQRGRATERCWVPAPGTREGEQGDPGRPWVCAGSPRSQILVVLPGLLVAGA